MQLKIISDGTQQGTRVELPDGSLLPGVQWVQIFLDTSGNEVTLGFNNVILDMVVDDTANNS